MIEVSVKKQKPQYIRILRLLHGRSDSNARHLVLETSALPTELHPYERRERDSNPRYLSVQRFSRPPQSTTLPSLQSVCKSKLYFGLPKILKLFFQTDWNYKKLGKFDFLNNYINGLSAPTKSIK